jgi:IrrE N-terminal-like domain
MSEEEVKWVRDTTGRFDRRPWYSQAYLDRRCEEILFEFLNQLYGQATIPVPTATLIKLIERDAKPPVDLYADLGKVEPNIWGVTFFEPPNKPEVRIAGNLYRDPHGSHLLRFTLAHEYLHVHLHNPLYQQAGRANRGEQRCSIDEALGLRPTVDWMEWHSNYGGAALLMPVSRVKLLVKAYRRATGGSLPFFLDSREAIDLVQRVSEAFDVSPEAARVRLIQLGYLLNVSD